MTDLVRPFAALELLAPARDAESAREAIVHGADAVYIGGPAFGARRAAGNSFDDLARIVEYAHRYRCRVYMTLNTLVYDNEMQRALEVAHTAKDIGVDALIVQDLGLLQAGLPDIEIHASTQCDIRTPEKAAFFDALGFSQVVPARELTLKEIAAIRSAMPRARIEFFIAGALCVSYSGQCYLSAALTGRSANRGECSQPCRLPYDVEDLDGNEIVHAKHVLSLMDNDQSDNLEKLIAAGVSSFKIEGRLKGPEYVKNLTAFYRKRLDAILEKHAGCGWERASVGESTFSFEPDPEKTFRRGATDYFVNGRRERIAALETPKSTGAFIGTVAAVNTAGQQSVDIKTRETIANGDGLVYLNGQDELCGLHVNRAQELRPGLVRIFLHEPLKRHPGLVPGVKVNRNKDHRFEKLLTQESAERTIAVCMDLAVYPDALELTCSAAGVSACVRHAGPVQSAQNPTALDKLKASLAKTGGTAFRAAEVSVRGCAGPATPFVPVSVANGLRRDALAKLSERILQTHPRSHRLAAADTVNSPFVGLALDFRANAANAQTVRFYKRYGAAQVQGAFETTLAEGGLDLFKAPLMRCRHCVRHTLGLCPKHFGKDAASKEVFKRMNGGRMKPLPLVLVGAGGTRLLARFDCRACEMTVSLIAKDLQGSALKAAAGLPAT